MSGLEAAAAVGGLIGLTIAAIDASIQIYDAVKDKSGIPEKLRKVSDTLPSLAELLKGARAQFDKDQPTKQAWLEVEKDLERIPKDRHRHSQPSLQERGHVAQPQEQDG
jgi:hypothetical protein